MNRKALVYSFFVLSFSALITVLVIRSHGFEPMDNQKQANARYTKLTTVEVKNAKLNVGKIDVDEAHLAKANSVLYNTGEETLIIDRVEVSCHCSSGEIPKRPIQPGDSAVIQVLYTKTITGFFYSDVIIHGNFEDSPALLSFEGQLVY